MRGASADRSPNNRWWRDMRLPKLMSGSDFSRVLIRYKFSPAETVTTVDSSRGT